MHRGTAWVLKVALLIVVGAMLSACMSADMRQYGKIDPNEKTITVSPGGGLAAVKFATIASLTGTLDHTDFFVV